MEAGKPGYKDTIHVITIVCINIYISHLVKLVL